VTQDQRAAQLRSASLTYAQIGDQLGISVTSAYESAMRGMVVVPTDDVIAAKQLELAGVSGLSKVEATFPQFRGGERVGRV